MTTWVLALVVLAGALLLLLRNRARPSRRPAPTAEIPDDLEMRFDAAFAANVELKDGLIASRLDQVVTRQVPVRRLEAVPELHTVRLCFADGTRLFGKGASPGDLGVLCMLLPKHKVWPARSSRDGAGNHLLLSVQGRRDPVDVVITGLDQPD